MNKNKFNYNLKLLCEKLIENKENKIFFWGASEVLKDLISKVNLDEFDILGIIDIDNTKEKTHLGKYKIFSPLELSKYKKMDNVKILFAINNKNKARYEITLKLLEKLKIKTEIMENCFGKTIKDKDVEELASNKLFLVNKLTGKKVQVAKIKGLDIVWEGLNSTIEITYPYTKFLRTKITLGDNCKVKIGSSGYAIENLDVVIRNKSTLTIGENFSCRGAMITMYSEPNISVAIGDDCMFSHSINIMASDGHTIYDDKGNILNEAQDLTIGNHVWVGSHVEILKNTKIPNNTIIGTGSVVNKKFKQEKTIIAGCPAKVVKKNVNWDRRTIAVYKAECKLEDSIYQEVINGKH